jgi:hypothetical protein
MPFVSIYFRKTSIFKNEHADNERASQMLFCCKNEHEHWNGQWEAGDVNVCNCYDLHRFGLVGNNTNEGGGMLLPILIKTFTQQSSISIKH